MALSVSSEAGHQEGELHVHCKYTVGLLYQATSFFSAFIRTFPWLPLLVIMYTCYYFFCVKENCFSV